MIHELKTAPQFLKKISGRTVIGIFAVHGNIDSGNDRSHPGSFARAVAAPGRVKFLWQHDLKSPPVATVKALREVGRSELPAAVLAVAPEATGGVEVTREYLDTDRGNEVLAGLKGGAITEMSYGYDADGIDFESVDGVRVRNLRRVKLYEVSDVLWGMNAATLAAKAGYRCMSADASAKAYGSADQQFAQAVSDFIELQIMAGTPPTSERVKQQIANARLQLLDLELTPYGRRY